MKVIHKKTRDGNINNFNIEGLTLGKLIAIQNALSALPLKSVLQTEILTGLNEGIEKNRWIL